MNKVMRFEQLKLPLFADELVEPKIEIFFKVKFSGMRRAHHAISIERTDTNTIIKISGLNYLGKSTGIKVRYLAEPGLFDLPFDNVIPGLARLPQDQLIAFGKRMITQGGSLSHSTTL